MSTEPETTEDAAPETPGAPAEGGVPETEAAQDAEGTSAAAGELSEAEAELAAQRLERERIERRKAEKKAPIEAGAKLSGTTADLLAACAAQGVDVDQVHPEYAAGQFEISVGALDPVAAADRRLLVRQTIRAVARRHGLRVSFAPAVSAEGVGNGGHLHLSAWRDGVNLHSGGDRRYGMTADAESFAAGILAHLPGLTSVTAPSPASYLRLRPSQWAGVFTAWGRETRET
ncbi:hypothetical protein ACTWQJ_42075, partial [Streptomyces sp. KR55]